MRTALLVLTPLAVQENHNVANDFLFRPRILDALSQLRANAAHILQPGRLRFDHVEDFLAERCHELFGVDRPDALDHAAAQILLDALPSRRRCAVEHLGSELESKISILHPTTFGGHPLTGADRRERSDHRHLIPVPFCLYLQDRKTVLLIEERDSLDQTGEAFGLVRCGIVTQQFLIVARGK